jgi:hypothetical protein
MFVDCRQDLAAAGIIIINRVFSGEIGTVKVSGYRIRRICEQMLAVLDPELKNLIKSVLF